MGVLFMLGAYLFGLTVCGYSSQTAGFPYGDTGTQDEFQVLQKRSLKLIMEGVNALKILLQGATKVRSNSKMYRRYFKQGDIKTAYNDFYAANPTTVSSYTSNGIKRLHGIVGDREVILRDPSKSVNNDGLIYIDLVDPKSKRKLKPGDSVALGQYVDRVTYTTEKIKQK